MKRVLLIIAFLLTSAFAFGQGNSVTILFPGVPTGGCSFVMYAQNNATGDLYNCFVGSWHPAGTATGTGTVTTLSIGNLSPIFTAAVANASTTPAISFTLSTAAADTVLGNCTGSTAAPSYCSVIAAMLPSTTVNSVVNDTNVTGSITAQALTLGWTGTLAAGRLNANVVQAFTNDTNVTASITAQNATLGWTGTLAKGRTLATTVYTDQSNTFSTGTQDFSSVTLLKMRNSAGLTTTVNGDFGLDTTNYNLHLWNGADLIVPPAASGFVSGNCPQLSIVAGKWIWADSGSTNCGGGGSSTNFQTNTTPLSSSTTVNFQNSAATNGITLTFANPSAGNVQLGFTGTLNNSGLTNTATTVNSQTCTLGSTCTIPFQTNSVSNTSQAGINLLTSTANSVGLTVTPTNSGTNQEKFEVTGGSYTGNAATASNLSGCTATTAGSVCIWNGSGWTLFAGNSSGSSVLTENSSGVPSWGSGASTVFQTNGTGLSSSSTVNYQNSVATNGVTYTFANPSAGNVQLGVSGTLNNSGLTNSATTVNSQTCTLGSACTIPFQTNTVNNTSQAGINLLTSTANTIGLTITPTNSATNQEKFEATGTLTIGGGGTGQTTASAAFIALSPLTTLGDTIAQNITPVRIPGSISATMAGYTQTGNGSQSAPPVWKLYVGGGTNPVAATVSSPQATQIYVYNGSGVLTNAYSGVNVDPQTGDYALSCPTDRLGEIDFNLSAAHTLTLPQAGSTGCLGSNIAFVVRNAISSTAVLTVTATTSLFQPEAVASHTILPGAGMLVYSDAVGSTGDYHALDVPAANGAVNTQTASYVATAADRNKMIVMNCASACALTLPAAPPEPKWNLLALSIGATTATISLNSLNFNGSGTAPTLTSGHTLEVFTDGSNYFGDISSSGGAGVSSGTQGYNYVNTNGSTGNATSSQAVDASQFSGATTDVQIQNARASSSCAGQSVNGCVVKAPFVGRKNWPTSPFASWGNGGILDLTAAGIGDYRASNTIFVPNGVELKGSGATSPTTASPSAAQTITGTQSAGVVTLTTTSGNFSAAFGANHGIKITCTAGTTFATFNVVAPIASGGAGGATLTYADAGAAGTCTAGSVIAYGDNSLFINNVGTIIRACNPKIFSCVTEFVVPKETVSGGISVSATPCAIDGGGNLAGTNCATVTVANTLSSGQDVFIYTASGGTAPFVSYHSWVAHAAAGSFTVPVSTGIATGTLCATTCGGAIVYEGTPLIELGGVSQSANAGKSYNVRAHDFTADCSYIPGCIPFVNSTAEEGSSWYNVHATNSDMLFRVTQQGTAYGGTGADPGGANNSDSYHTMIGQFLADSCELTSGSSNCFTAAGIGGPVYEDTANNNPEATNPLNCDAIGFSLDGTTQATDKLKAAVYDFTMTANSQSPNAVAQIPVTMDSSTCGNEYAGRTPIGVFASGFPGTIRDYHIEYFGGYNELGGNAAVNPEFPGQPTQNVELANFETCCGASGAGSYSVDIGATNTVTMSDARNWRSLSLSNMLKDNVTGNTCNAGENEEGYYFLGNSSASVLTNCVGVTNAMGALKLAGTLTDSVAGAVSQAAVTISGAPFTGGSGTTTFPLVYLRDGTDPTTFSTSGTELGFNAPVGFVGNFLDFHVNGASSVAKLDASGNFTGASYTATGANAGFFQCTQGSANGHATATTFTLECPAAVTAYEVLVPGAAATGILHWTNASNVVTESVSAVSLTVDVSGVLPLANMTQLFQVNAQTATYQVVAADFADCKTIPVASGTFTITLVASGTQPASGQCVDIVNYGSGVVTVARSGQNINGAAANLTLSAGSASAPNGLHVVSDGTNYVAQPWGSGSGSGTVTSIATTSPITGGTITTSGTIACATCVTSAASLTSGAIMTGAGSQGSQTNTTGTGVVTALGVNTGSAGAFVVNGGALGTPSSGTLTNATGLPLNGVVTPTGAITEIQDGNNPLLISSAQTTDAQDAVAFNEHTAATGGTLTNALANQSQLHVGTASGSTAAPVEIEQLGITATTGPPAFQIESTWNNASLVGHLILGNVTNTASAAGSNLIDLRVGNTSEINVSPTGVMQLGNPAAFVLGTGTAYIGAEGTGFTGQNAYDGTYPNSISHCLDIINQQTDVGCADAASNTITLSNKTIIGSPAIQVPMNAIGIFNPTALPVTFANASQSLAVGTQYGLPGIIDKSIGVTTAAMATQATNAAIPITGMYWNTLNSKNYLLRCEIPMTLTTTATLAFSLSNSSLNAATSYSLDASGLLGAAVTYGEISTLAQTAFNTKTSTSGAVAGTTVIHVWAQIQNSATSGGILALNTWDVAATGTIQVLANATCTLTQEN